MSLPCLLQRHPSHEETIHIAVQRLLDLDDLQQSLRSIVLIQQTPLQIQTIRCFLPLLILEVVMVEEIRMVLATIEMIDLPHHQMLEVAKTQGIVAQCHQKQMKSQILC